MAVQKRVNIACLTAILWKGLLIKLAFGLHLRTYISGSSHHQCKCSKLCKQHGLCRTSAFDSELELRVWMWYVPGGATYMTTIGPWVSNEIPGLQHFTHAPKQLTVWGLSTSCVTPLGWDSWKPVPTVLWTSSCTSLCWLCCAAFHWTSQLAVCHHRLHPLIPPRGITEPGVVLGPLTQLLLCTNF